MIKLGSKVLVSDPCYEYPTWCTGTLENVKPGNYNTNVIYYKDTDNFFNGRVGELIAIHESYTNKDLPWQITEADIGVDSGQCGIFDFEQVKDIIGAGEWDEEDKFYAKACACTDDDKQYDEMGNYGVVSRSGVGDGSYDLYVADIDGEIVGIKVVFIDSEAEEDEYENEDEE